jgi:Tol biopolymer transport system component
LRPAIVPASDGAAPQVLREMPRPDWDSLKWTPDSRALTYIATRNGASNLWLQPIDGGAARQLTTFQSQRIFRFAWSPDGESVVCDRGEDLKEIILISDFRD